MTGLGDWRGHPSRRLALGAALLPLAGHLTEAAAGDEDSHLAAAATPYQLTAQHGDGPTVVAISPAPLDAVRAALIRAGFRTDVPVGPGDGDSASRWKMRS